jgi:hypothetical protein
MMKRQDRLADYRLTDHARFEMIRRQISEEEVARILSNPEQVLEVRPSRFIYQARVKFGESSKTYLLRVFVDNDRNPPEVVTVYRTRKVDKYWRGEP